MFNLSFDSYYGEGDIEKVIEFESQLGFEFPVEYKDIVAQYNGAFIQDKNVFRFHSKLHGEEAEYGAGMFLVYGEIEGVTESMVAMNGLYPPDGFTKGLVIFSIIGNGDALCFDYRDTKNDPAVVVWHHEGSPEEGNETSLVAKSFTEFLEMLYEEEDDDD